MNQTAVLSDPQLGEILFRKNNRSSRYIIRIKPQSISVTIPYGGTYKRAKAFFNEKRALIIQKKEKINTRKAALPKPETPFYNEDELRCQANAFLPGALAQLAREYGFIYQSVTIRKSKTRWGSCSSKKAINLSLYLMLLPSHLKEYVMLHELCHTIHMNHGTAFWALLDQCTSRKSKELRNELKMFRLQ
jgi:predicted metal-dependent hydrolase